MSEDACSADPAVEVMLDVDAYRRLAPIVRSLKTLLDSGVLWFTRHGLMIIDMSARSFSAFTLLQKDCFCIFRCPEMHCYPVVYQKENLLGFLSHPPRPDFKNAIFTIAVQPDGAAALSLVVRYEDESAEKRFYRSDALHYSDLVEPPDSGHLCSVPLESYAVNEIMTWLGTKARNPGPFQLRFLRQDGTLRMETAPESCQDDLMFSILPPGAPETEDSPVLCPAPAKGRGRALAKKLGMGPKALQTRLRQSRQLVARRLPLRDVRLRVEAPLEVKKVMACYKIGRHARPELFLPEKDESLFLIALAFSGEEEKKGVTSYCLFPSKSPTVEKERLKRRRRPSTGKGSGSPVLCKKPRCS